MPEPQHESDVFLGEHGWSPASIDSLGVNPVEPVRAPHKSSDCPVPVYLTTCEYLSEAGGFDCSIGESHAFLVPHPLLISGMDLSWFGDSANFYDSEGHLAAFDPDHTGIDAHLWVREDLLSQFLEREGLALVWIVLGEKETIAGARGWDWAGSLHYTGAYRYEPEATVDERIQGELRFRQQYPESRNE